MLKRTNSAQENDSEPERQVQYAAPVKTRHVSAQHQLVIRTSVALKLISNHSLEHLLDAVLYHKAFFNRPQIPR